MKTFYIESVYFYFKLFKTVFTCWKVDNEARMDPPIQTEYFLSGGAMILIFMVGGAKAEISFCMRSETPKK